MDEFEVEELIEYINTGIRVAKKEGVDDKQFFVRAIQTLMPVGYLDLDEAIERVRQVAIDMHIVEDEDE